jgi:hypothetical protein
MKLKLRSPLFKYINYYCDSYLRDYIFDLISDDGIRLYLRHGCLDTMKATHYLPFYGMIFISYRTLLREKYDAKKICLIRHVPTNALIKDPVDNYLRPFWAYTNDPQKRYELIFNAGLVVFSQEIPCPLDLTKCNMKLPTCYVHEATRVLRWAIDLKTSIVPLILEDAKFENHLITGTCWGGIYEYLHQLDIAAQYLMYPIPLKGCQYRPILNGHQFNPCQAYIYDGKIGHTRTFGDLHLYHAEWNLESKTYQILLQYYVTEFI